MTTSISESEKVRENRLRRAADRQGLRLLKSRMRDPRGLTYGRYGLVAVEGGGSVVEHFVGTPYGFADLDEIEEWLTTEERNQAEPETEAVGLSVDPEAETLCLIRSNQPPYTHPATTFTIASGKRWDSCQRHAKTIRTIFEMLAENDNRTYVAWDRQRQALLR